MKLLLKTKNCSFFVAALLMLAEGNKLTIKKDGNASMFYNGMVR